MKNVVWLVVAGVAIYVLYTTVHDRLQTGSSRNAAPNFMLPDIQGKPVRLVDFKGKVVILDFWATWCPPCREEIPHFIELYNEYKHRGLEIIGIALDQGGAKDVQPFAREQKINYPVVIGNSKVARDYGGIRGVPTTFIIDREGTIVEKFVGYRDKQTFVTAIQELL